MKHLAKYLVILIIFMSCSQLDLEKVSRVVIIQRYYENTKMIEKIIYDGTAIKVRKMLSLLSKSKVIEFKEIIKEALIDGEYIVELYKGNELIRRYIIFNSRNIYDETSDVYLECAVLDYLPNRTLNQK